MSRWAALPLLFGLVLANGGCDRGELPQAGPSKVALIGWDGASWDVIDEMLEEGRLPNLAGLIERGSRANLIAHDPLLSPVAWTTLATGFDWQQHGVSGFILPHPDGGGGKVLASSLHRKRAPLWKIVSDAGLQVGFIGWWTTWPAEPVNGYMVSDHLAYNRWDAWASRVGEGDAMLTFPLELTAELRPHAVTPDQVTGETLAPLVSFNQRERQAMMAVEKPIKFHAPSVTRFGYSTDASVLAFTHHLLETRGQPDLLAVVFILTDVAGHVFWHHYEPERFPPGRFGPLGRHREAIPNIYAETDRWTGEILERLDPDTHVIVLSDHGMGAEGMLPTPGRNPSGDHEPEGIFVLSGPGLPEGRDLGDIDALDFAPTVLALLGLPTASDMPGRAHEGAIPESLRKQLPPVVASYGDGRSAVPAELPSTGEEGYEDRLRALGYIE